MMFHITDESSLITCVLSSKTFTCLKGLNPRLANRMSDHINCCGGDLSCFFCLPWWCDVIWCDVSTRAARDVSVCSEINGRATWELIGKSETIIGDHNEEALRKCAQYYSTLHLSVIVCKTRTLSVPQFVKGCCHLCEDSRFFGSHQNVVNLPRNSSAYSSQGNTSKKFRARGH